VVDSRCADSFHNPLRLSDRNHLLDARRPQQNASGRTLHSRVSEDVSKCENHTSYLSFSEDQGSRSHGLRCTQRARHFQHGDPGCLSLHSERTRRTREPQCAGTEELRRTQADVRRGNFGRRNVQGEDLRFTVGAHQLVRVHQQEVLQRGRAGS